MNNTSLEEGCTFDDCYPEQALIFLPQVQTAFLVLYGIVSSIGALGNLFILVTVIRYLLTFPTSRLNCLHVCVQDPEPAHGDEPVCVQHGGL